MTNQIEFIRNSGYIYGYELLLRREDALILLNIFQQESIHVTGCNLWQFFNRERTQFIEIVGGCGLIECELSPTDTIGNIHKLRDFLCEPLPYEADLISFSFRDKATDDWLIPREKQYPHGKREVQT